MSHPEDEDPAALFRSAIGEVKPLRKPAAAPPPTPKPKPRARMAERDDQEARGEFARLLRDSSPLEAGDTASYRRDTLPARMFQRLKRGQYSVQDELDLHGATVAQAETLLRQFLLEAHAHEHGCVRIIHGKGLQSDGGAPVLKNLVDRLLRQRNDVLAFHSAPAGQGGTGAVLVLLSNR
ncbi:MULTISPECIES: Smr/MutS family protein [unclassified Stenotrophomonas]|jgi:DNA-nicking Smr family endonuclease|uniref:Smr/MutS family protein n=1 Tax=Stenotrophomonas TaxID=40323 RepID=UPI000D49A19B|nr:MULTISPECIES: Smr/MutS family protein [unclassified Stenotrophomonas]PTT57155.1 SMR domain protein [Stenotrophomonas sp. HMWF003]QHB70951.1 SMR domain protein [Stenotrophomonas sp. 364]